MDSFYESVVCAVHRLQTCLKYTLQEENVANLFSDAWKLVGHFCPSVKTTQSLKHKQKQAGITHVKKVIQDIVHQVAFHILHVGALAGTLPGHQCYALRQGNQQVFRC